MAYTSSSSDTEFNLGAYKAGLESVEPILEVYKKNEVVFEDDIKILKLDVMFRDKAITELRQKFEKPEKERDDLKLSLEKFKGEGCHAVPPPYTGNYMPLKPDLVFADEHVVLDDEEEDVSQPNIEKKIAKPSFVKINFVKAKKTNKTTRKTVKQVKHNRRNTHSPRGNQRNWNNMMSQRLGNIFEMFNKACQVCGSFEHLQYDCDYHQTQFNYQRMEQPVWNNAGRVNHQNSTRMTHPNPKRNMVPRTVLTKYGPILLNTAQTKRTVNGSRPMPYFSKTAHSSVNRPINQKTAFKNSNFDKRVNTVRFNNVTTARPKEVVSAVKRNPVNTVLGYEVYVVKASACWVWRPK
uniref:Retrotransposon Orf1 n=1 Tax=Tanacetum cinerariifolium TaxID=118510 RepID=A0A6L2JHW7_TANCI|nr:retrotransposon Orf1 [Tanacetum cinerariifolium]